MHRLPHGLYRIEAGYYYAAETQELLSLKSGELKPLKLCLHWLRRFGGIEKALGWRISVNGVRRSLVKETLEQRVRAGRYPQDGVIPIRRE